MLEKFESKFGRPSLNSCAPSVRESHQWIISANWTGKDGGFMLFPSPMWGISYPFIKMLLGLSLVSISHTLWVEFPFEKIEIENMIYIHIKYKYKSTGKQWNKLDRFLIYLSGFLQLLNHIPLLFLCQETSKLLKAPRYHLQPSFRPCLFCLRKTFSCPMVFRMPCRLGFMGCMWTCSWNLLTLLRLDLPSLACHTEATLLSLV